MKIGIVSGYFNPLHKGHIEYIDAAKNKSDYLIVIINNDKQVVIKGSKPFMDEEHRCKIVRGLKSVDECIISIDTDTRLVCKTIKFIKSIHPNDKLTFFNSGDRIGNNIEIGEQLLCKSLDIECSILPLPKIYSSSELLKNNTTPVDAINTILLDVLDRSRGDSNNHLMTLFSIVVQTKSKNMLELGVRDGNSSLPLLLGATLNGGKLTSIDLESTMWTPPEELKNNWEFIQSDSLNFLRECVKTDRKFDLFFVDDWHAYSHVKEELELISKLSDFHTMVLLHDLMHPSTGINYFEPTTKTFGAGWADGGPYKAVIELDKDYYEWATIPNSSGLTIIRKRPPSIIV